MTKLFLTLPLLLLGVSVGSSSLIHTLGTSYADSSERQLSRSDSHAQPKQDYTDWIISMHGDALQKAEILQWAIAQITMEHLTDNSTDPIDLKEFTFRETAYLRSGQSHILSPMLYGFSAAEIDWICDNSTLNVQNCTYTIRLEKASLVGHYNSWIFDNGSDTTWTGQGSYNHTFENVDIWINYLLVNDTREQGRARVHDIHSRVFFENCILWAENYTENGVEWTEEVWQTKSENFKIDYNRDFESKYEVYMSDTLAMYINAFNGFIGEYWDGIPHKIEQAPMEDYWDLILTLFGEHLQKINIVQWAFAQTYLTFLSEQGRPAIIDMKDFTVTYFHFLKPGYAKSTNATLHGMHQANISISLNTLAQTVEMIFRIPKVSLVGLYEFQMERYFPYIIYTGEGEYNHTFHDIQLNVSLSLVDDFGTGRVRVGHVQTRVAFSSCTLWAENFAEDGVPWSPQRWSEKSETFKVNYDRDYFPDYDVVLGETVALYFGLLWGYTGDSMREVLQQFVELDNILNPQP